MAQQVLGAVGAAVGFAVGGPTGAQYGWMIGSTVGGVLDPQVIQGPRIGEIAQQTSQEGVPRPIIFALSPPITGNIIATSDPVIVKRTESQGKGGPKVETESVFRTYAIGVCEGPIGGFVRVWRNGILVYDVSDNTLLDDDENNLFLEKATFFLGSFEQEPSADLEALFGAGTTPAHQGTAYMVMADEDLTDMRGAIPQFVFQVARGFAGSVSIVAVANSAGSLPSVLVGTSDDGQNYTGQTAAAEIGWESVAYAPELERYCAVAMSGTGNRIMTSDDNGATWELQNDPDTGLREWSRIIWIPGAGTGQGRFVVGTADSSFTEDEQTIITSDDGGETWVRRTTTDLPGRETYAFAYDPDAGILIAAGGLAVGTSSGNVVKSIDGGATWTGAFEGAPGSQRVRAACWSKTLSKFFCIGGEGGVFSSAFGETWIRTAADGTFDPTTNPACLVESERLGLLIAITEDGIYTSATGSAWTNRDTLNYSWGVAVDSLGLVIAVRDNSAVSSTRIRVSTDAITWADADTSINDRNWRSIAVAENQTISNVSYPLAEVVRELCLRAGLEERMFDVSQL